MAKKSVHDLSKKTIVNYENCLKRLDMDDLSDVNSVKDKCLDLIGEKDKRDRKRSEGQIANLMRQYISSIIYKLKVDLDETLDDEDKCDIESLLEKYRSMLQKYGIIYEESRDINVKNEREVDNWIEWEDALKLRDDFENQFKTENKAKKSRSKKLLIMGLYTCIPPRRIQDYLLMYYYKTRPDHLTDVKMNENKLSLSDINELDFDVDDADENGDIDIYKDHNEADDKNDKAKNLNNYYIKSEKKFIFCKYKTSDTFKTQEIDVPEKLNNYIKTYLNFHREIKEGRRLLNYKDLKCLRTQISSLFNEANCTRLRQSYISWYYKNNPNMSEEDKKNLGKLMGHSSKMASTYRKIDE